jgi:hypothetical protein
MPPKRKATSSNKAPTPKKRKAQSIWNTPDDWPQLISDSSLSTSSISTRLPRPRGLQSLVKCASDAASRGFKILWEDVGEVTVGGKVGGRRWKEWWGVIPDHLKIGIRESVYKLWGGHLSQAIIHEVGCGFSERSPDVCRYLLSRQCYIYPDIYSPLSPRQPTSNHFIPRLISTASHL